MPALNTFTQKKAPTIPIITTTNCQYVMCFFFSYKERRVTLMTDVDVKLCIMMGGGERYVSIDELVREGGKTQ